MYTPSVAVKRALHWLHGRTGGGPLVRGDVTALIGEIEILGQTVVKLTGQLRDTTKQAWMLQQKLDAANEMIEDLKRWIEAKK
jgi:hypothetical protein